MNDSIDALMFARHMSKKSFPRGWSEESWGQSEELVKTPPGYPAILTTWGHHPQGAYRWTRGSNIRRDSYIEEKQEVH